MEHPNYRYTLYTTSMADNDIPLQAHGIQFSAFVIPYIAVQYVKRDYLGKAKYKGKILKMTNTRVILYIIGFLVENRDFDGILKFFVKDRNSGKKSKL